jgi:HNH endonuclease
MFWRWPRDSQPRGRKLPPLPQLKPPRHLPGAPGCRAGRAICNRVGAAQLPAEMSSLCRKGQAMKTAKGQSLTSERARGLFAYDPLTGLLTWRNRSSRTAPAGSVAGRLLPCGYLQLKADGRNYLVHRVIWLMATGCWPRDQIDHIDGSRTNNRLENLRAATGVQNACNKAPGAANTSGHLGVCWNKGKEMWLVRISVNGKRSHVGYFRSLESAVKARQQAAERLHGEFAGHLCRAQVKTCKAFDRKGGK